MKKILKWVGIVFGVLIVLGIIANAGSSSKTPSTDSATGNKKEVITEQTSDTNKAVEEPKQVEVPMEVVTLTFISDFDKNQLSAEEKYKDKLVKLTAYIKNISEDIMGTPFLSLQPTTDQYYFGTTIQCLFKAKSELTSLENGKSVVVEGRFKSQDMGVIRIDNCKVVK